MYAGPVQVYQTCMHVGTSLQNDVTTEDMGNGRVQLLQTGANVIYMDADKMKL